MATNVSTPALSVEDRMLPNMMMTGACHLDYAAEVSTYPDDWPLSNTPLPVPLESDEEEELSGQGKTQRFPTGASTPPRRQQKQQNSQQHHLPQRTSSLSSTTSRLRRSSSVTTAPGSPLTRKRLSLNLPVHASTTPPMTPPSPELSETVLSSLADSTAYLTALAAQERRVLELKEELEKAETELTKLKRQWATQETMRKRHELLQSEVGGGTDGEIGEGQRIMSPTFEERQARRKAAMAKLTQTSTRSVTSQRHHRTLSLLSPDRLKAQQHSFDLKDDEAHSNASTPLTSTIQRAETLPTSTGRPRSLIEISSIKRQSQDVIPRIGKQMAEGFKEGLWAFVEDLKQATVGDDTRIQTPTSANIRRVSSKASLRSVSSTNSRRERSPTKDMAATDLVDLSEYGPWKKHSPTDAVVSAARWSSSTTLSQLGGQNSSLSLSHSRSSTPRTSTSSVRSSNSAAGQQQGQQGPQRPLWGSVMSVSTQFSLKRTATIATTVLTQVEKALQAMPIGDDDENIYVTRSESTLRQRTPRSLKSKRS